MNIPKITFYNLWCIKTLDEYRRMTAKGGIIDGMLKAQDEGLVEHICMTTHANGDETAEMIKDGRVEGVTIGYNAVNFAYRRAGLAASFAAKKGVVVMNPLGGGEIPKNPDRFGFLTEGTSDSVAVAALKFLVAHKEVTVTLPGFSTVAELEDAVLATKNLPTIDNAYLENLAKKLGEELNTLCTGCGYCDKCPHDIAVPKLLEAYNAALMAQPFDISKVDLRLKDHWGMTVADAVGCVECGICEQACTQKLPIIERLKEIAAQV